MPFPQRHDRVSPVSFQCCIEIFNIYLVFLEYFHDMGKSAGLILYFYSDYLGHLVKNHLRDESVPEPAGENEQADAFVALLKSTLAESVFEETAVRDFYETYGPLDLPRVEQILSDLLEVHPDNHHIRFYLKTIRNGDPHT